MIKKKSYSLPRSTPIMGKPTLEQLMNARRPLLFSRMPRMLRDDGEMAGGGPREFRYIEGIEPHPAPVSVHRWRVALQMSRILRAQRRKGSSAR